MGSRILSPIKIKLFFMLLCSQTFLVPTMISDRSVRRWHFLVNRSCVGGCGKKLEVVGKIFVWVQSIWLGANVQKILRAEMSQESSSSMDFLRPLMIFFVYLEEQPSFAISETYNIRQGSAQKMKLQIRYSEWFSWWYFLLTWNKVVLRQSLGLRA